jgi:cell division protein FtsL
MHSGRTPITRSGGALGQAGRRLPSEVGPWLYILLLLCLIGLVAFLYLAQTASVAKRIEEMESLEEDLRDLKRDNNALLLQIAQRQQMSRIKQEARAMGLAEAEHVEHVEVMLDQPDASLGDDMAHNSPSSSPLGSSHLPAWLNRVVRQFGRWTSGHIVRAEDLDR